MFASPHAFFIFHLDIKVPLTINIILLGYIRQNISTTWQGTDKGVRWKNRRNKAMIC